MKRLIRHFLINLLALYFVGEVASGLVYEKGFETFLLAGGALTVVTIFAKPIINLLLLPLNLITFGLFRWISSAIALYIVTLLTDGFRIENFVFRGVSTKWIDIPSMNFQGTVALIAFSFLLSFITSFLHWVRK